MKKSLALLVCTALALSLHAGFFDSEPPLSPGQEMRLGLHYLNHQDLIRGEKLLSKHLAALEDPILYNECIRSLDEAYRREGKITPTRYKELKPVPDLSSRSSTLEPFEPAPRISATRLSQIDGIAPATLEKELDALSQNEDCRRYEILSLLARHYERQGELKKANQAVNALLELCLRITDNQQLASADRLSALRTYMFHERSNRSMVERHIGKVFDISYLSFDQICATLSQNGTPKHYKRLLSEFGDEMTPSQKMRVYGCLGRCDLQAETLKEIVGDESYLPSVREDSKYSLLHLLPEGKESEELFSDLKDRIKEERTPERLTRLLDFAYARCQSQKDGDAFMEILAPIAAVPDRLEPRQKSVFLSLAAGIYRQERKNVQSEQCLLSAMELADSRHHRSALAALYAEEGQLEKCLAMLQKLKELEEHDKAQAQAPALSLKGSDFDSLEQTVNRCAGRFREQKDFEGAVKIHQIQLDSDQWSRLRAAKEIAGIYQAMGKPQPEIASFVDSQLARPATPDNNYLRLKLELLLFSKSSHYDEIERTYGEFQDETWYLGDNVAYALMDAGRTEKAHAIWLHLAEKRNHPRERGEKYACAARASAEMGAISRAKAEYEKALESIREYKENIPDLQNSDELQDWADTRLSQLKEEMRRRTQEKATL